MSVPDLEAPDLKHMPLACPHCGCEAGRYDFGKINVDGKRIEGLTPDAVNLLTAYSWPGNVRELRNYVERSMILGCFPSAPSRAAPVASTPDEAPAAGELALTLAEVERRHIERVVDDCAGNKTEAARRLGVSRKTLERKFAEWAAAQATDAGRVGRRA